MIKAVMKIGIMVTIGAVMLFGQELFETFRNTKPTYTSVINGLNVSETVMPSVSINAENKTIEIRVGKETFKLDATSVLNPDTISALKTFGINVINKKDEFTLMYKGKVIQEFNMEVE